MAEAAPDTDGPTPGDTPASPPPPGEPRPAEPPPEANPAADTPPAESAPAGTPRRDTSPPDTAIASPTVDGGRATFTFTSTEAHSTFHCRLDRAAFARCSSPAAYTGVAVGSHTFRRMALDPYFNPPAIYPSR